MELCGVEKAKEAELLLDLPSLPKDLIDSV